MRPRRARCRSRRAWLARSLDRICRRCARPGRSVRSYRKLQVRSSAQRAAPAVPGPQDAARLLSQTHRTRISRGNGRARKPAPQQSCLRLRGPSRNVLASHRSWHPPAFFVCDFRDSRVIQHAAAVLSVTSTRAESEAGALLQTLAQCRTHQRARRPGATLTLHVAHQAESALGDHLAGRALARIAVARDYRLDPSAIRQLAQEEDIVEALLALFPSRACAGFETAGPK